MPLTLAYRPGTTLPVEADAIAADRLAGLSAEEAARRPILVGNQFRPLGELFSVAGDARDGLVIVQGDLRGVRRIGQGMASGTLRVEGDAGDHLGEEMTGGTIEVLGSAGDWAGASMRGGLIRVRGDAGDFLGSAGPGEPVGMRGGAILVEGAVGIDAGLAMRRGLIAVGGAAGIGLGRGLVAGSIFAFGPVDRLAGAGMKRGTIALFGSPVTELLVTFRHACRFRPPFLGVYLKQLASWGFPLPGGLAPLPVCDRYNGDLLEGGKGEILRMVSG
jgi:formylmethanofuran dehydrogenase subunit C